MKEFDFDELDKAVNSLMSETKKVDTSPPDTTPAPSAPPAVAPVSSIASPVVSVPMPTVTPMPAPAPVAETRPSLAPKRSGRFMDVVHPSSDMTLPQVPRRPTPSREGAVVAPLSPSAPLTPVVSNAPEPQLETLAVPPSAAQVESDSTDATSTFTESWPDPIEATSVSPTAFEDTPVINATSATSESTSPSEDDALAKEVASVPDVSLSSPFLPDTKVEKRPLGVQATSQAPVVAESDSKSDLDNQANDRPSDIEEDTQVSPQVDLPAELHQDLLNVEADSAATTPDIASVDTESSSIALRNQTPVPSLGESNSIAQQYMVKATSSDTDHTPVYDSAAQALSHPEKKKSGWLIVLSIILVLALFAAAGVGLYYTGLL